MQFSLERLCSDTDLQIPNDKHEWAKIYTPVSLLTQRAVLTSSSDDLAIILHFKKNNINTFHELFFPLCISKESLVYGKGQGPHGLLECLP